MIPETEVGQRGSGVNVVNDGPRGVLNWAQDDLTYWSLIPDGAGGPHLNGTPVRREIVPVKDPGSSLQKNLDLLYFATVIM